MKVNSQDVKNAISGVLVVDKPVGMTSHDVVQAIRNGTNLRRAGHTGTLDPRASGVLVILVGPAVRLSEYVSASDKRYQAIIRLGGRTDTFDAEGKVTPTNQPINVTEQQFEEVLKTFIGEIEQTPPPYSAVKVQGRKAYEMARKGEEVELEQIGRAHVELQSRVDISYAVFCLKKKHLFWTQELNKDPSRLLSVCLVRACD